MRIATITALLMSMILLLTPVRPLVAQQTTLKVAIKPLTPFVMYGESNQYSGFSIDLWVEIAKRMNVTYEYLPLNTVAEVLDAVQSKQVDLGIAGISITKEREQVLDFSQPMFNSGLKILVAAHQGDAGVGVLLQLLTPNLLVMIAILVVVIVAVGHLVWFFERNNPAFTHAYVAGVGEGIWWAASSLLGSADKMPRSIVGRVGAIIWVISGIILISLFTANLAAINTVQQLESNIQGLNDLPGKRITTVENTTAARFLSDQQLPFTTVNTIDDAYQLLNTKRTDAVIYDAPVLQYYANTTGRGLVTIVGSLFNRQDYGIALPTGSTNRELIDQALLSIIEDGTYESLYQRWFGST